MRSTINRRHALQTLGITAGSIAFPSIIKSAEQQKPNVLFIAIDDLRPQLKCYGHHQMISPHIDGLAHEGIQFTQAYCQVPVCGASRASLLSGLRPNRNRFLGYSTKKDEDAPDALSLPHHFKQQGYHTVSNGKIYHHRTDDIEAWTEEPWKPKRREGGSWRNYLNPENIEISNNSHNQRGPAYEIGEAGDFDYFDGRIAKRSMIDLQRLKDKDEPFFLATGFLKPHLPFNAPKRFWDMYNEDDLDMADNPFRPKNAPDSALHNWGELRNYYGIPQDGDLSEEMARTLVHGYYACTTYADFLVGELLAELKRLELDENTIVILWGDHGWNLQEHGLWCKHCNFETSLHVPMIVKAPGFSGDKKTPALTEFIDIYPSLCDLAGLPVPEHCEGTSFVPLMEQPEREWKPAVFSRFYKGDSVKTERYRFTEWTDDDGDTYAKMLYDHKYDPMENINVVDQADYGEAVKEMQNWLEKGWKAARPKA